MSSGVCPKLSGYKLGAGPPGHCDHLRGHLNSCQTGAVLEPSKFPNMFKVTTPTHSPGTG